jgi:predicted Zn-dependent peptidase
VLELIFTEFSELKATNISKEELANTITKISKGSTRRLQTSESWVDFHEREAIFEEEKVHSPEDYMETLRNLSLKDIDNVIQKYLTRESFYTAICGDYR